MKKKEMVRAAVWLLSALLLLGSVSPALAAAPVYRQTHVVEDYRQRNAALVHRLYDGCGRALDGSDGTPDLCIPGLTEQDNMVPQGIAYYAAKNQMLISAYSKSDAGSVIFALDMADGHLAAEYHVYRRSGNAAQGHFGGIAVSEHNLYFADYESTVSYVPLSALNAEDGTAADVTLAGTTNCGDWLNGANTSWLGCGDGMLWTGNYYEAGNDSYNKKAADDCGTVILCFDLHGDDPESEWASLSPDGRTCAAPTYTLRVPDGLEKVQGAWLHEETAYLNTSAGEEDPDYLYTAKVDYEAGRILSDGLRRTEAIPYAEDLTLADGTLYTLAESAAYCYFTESKRPRDPQPTDTVWAVSVDRLERAQSNPLRSLLRVFRWLRFLFDWLKVLCP